MAKLEPVNVYLRLRDEGQNSKHNIVEVLSDREIQLKHQHPKRFGFNRVFTSKSGQAAIYNNVVAPLVEKTLNGFTCTLLTYGQSGSGKSYTLFGDVSDHTRYGSEDSADGCIPRALVSIFDEMKKLSKNVERTVRVSYVELFNEELIDLLYDNSEPPQPLRILEDPEQKGTMYIQNLSAHTICDTADIKKLLDTASENHRNSSTLENSETRSHRIFTVHVYTRIVVVPGEEHLKSGKLIFVDTAACENLLRKSTKGGAGGGGGRRAGGNTMNQSLVTLTSAVRALEERSQYVPLSESKLTKILRESFRGRSKTAVIATVSLLRNDIEHTLNTLTFAKGARTIRNPIEMNKITTKSNIVNCLYEELHKLQKELIALRSSTGFYVHAENYNSILKETSRKEKELTDKLKQIAEMEEQVKELEVEKLLREKEWEAVMKSFEITKARAILHKTTLLRRRMRLENVKGALQDTDAAIAPILEQERELRTLLAATTTDYRVLQQKTEFAHRKLLQNDELGRNFCETVVDTCASVVKTLQEHEDGVFQTITEVVSEVVGASDELCEESGVIAEKTRVALADLERVLKSAQVDRMRSDVTASFAAFSGELQQSFDFLLGEKELLQQNLQLLQRKLQETADAHKTFNKQQLDSAQLLKSVGGELLGAIDVQTSGLQQLCGALGAIEVDVRGKGGVAEVCAELQRKLEVMGELNRRGEVMEGDAGGVSRSVQILAGSRGKVMADDVAELEDAMKSIDQCVETLKKENNVPPLTAFENVFDFVELKEKLLAIDKQLQEDTHCLQQNTDKEEICNNVVKCLQTLSQTNVDIAADLREQLAAEVQNYFAILDELQRCEVAMYTKITETVNGATATVNECIEKMEDGHVLQSIENNQLRLSEQGLLLLREDGEDLRESQMIREILEKLDKLK